MRASVLAGFRPFTTKFEGQVPYMYTDAKGLVTTGVGNLIDPINLALALPWQKPDGSALSGNEINTVWEAVKQGYPDKQSVASGQIEVIGVDGVDLVKDVTLSNDAITELVNSKLKANEAILQQHFPNWNDWPADAQMGALSMAWAMGPYFNFPKFKAATDKLDFAAAAKEAGFQGVGIGARLAADQVLFHNADIVQRSGGDKEKLWYPAVATPGSNLNYVALGIGLALIVTSGTVAYYMIKKG